MSDMRKKVEDAYATKGEHAEAYLLGVALSLLSRTEQHLTGDFALLGEVRDFRHGISDHQDKYISDAIDGLVALRRRSQ